MITVADLEGVSALQTPAKLKVKTENKGHHQLLSHFLLTAASLALLLNQSYFKVIFALRLVWRSSNVVS